jgi:DNA adenine methylase
MNEDSQLSRNELSITHSAYFAQNIVVASPKVNFKRIDNMLVKPFVKWVGGKRQLISLLSSNVPKSYNSYIEPFIGGGALFFSMRPDEGIISDINPELINAYEVVRDDVYNLIESLKQHKNEEEYFYSIRAQKPTEMTPVQRASRFIFMNKTCFNGLYRENSKGQFNTPFGRYKNPNIADVDTLQAVSVYLKQSNISILHQDYKATAMMAKKGDFVYFDPPYYPMSATANFTKYAKGDFNEQNQRELADVFFALAERGCYVMLSNSNTEFIKNLYNDFDLIEVEANRFINCQGENRGKQPVEVLVKNF